MIVQKHYSNHEALTVAQKKLLKKIMENPASYDEIIEHVKLHNLLKLEAFEGIVNVSID